MGLSNEERYEKITHSINHIVDFAEKFKDYEKLKKLVDNLWYEFLKNASNGAFWLMGSDIANDWMERETLAGVAFACHVPSKGDFLEEMTQERREKDKFYDSYKILSGFCDMERLLGLEKGAVLMVYLHTQNIGYALCRYPDEWRERYEDLNRLMRAIQGECFRIMKTDRDYAYAWMLHNLCDKIFTSEESDIVNKWWVKQCLPHRIKLDWQKYDAVYAAFRKFQFRDLTVPDRIDLTFTITDNKYGEYEHQHKEFLELVQEYNKDKKNKVKIDVKEIEQHYKKCKKALEDKKKEPYYRECEFTGNYIDRDGNVKNLYE